MIKRFLVSYKRKNQKTYTTDIREQYRDFETAVERAETLLSALAIIDYQIVMIKGYKRKTYDRATICYMYWGDDTDYMWEEVENE